MLQKIRRRGCWDADEDNMDNRNDNCPHDANPDQSDADDDGIGDACDPTPDSANEDPDGDGYASKDYNADRLRDDNCPLIANADQTDDDNNGIGDACQAVACDHASGPACIDVNGSPVVRNAMNWVWDIATPKAQALATAQAKLFINAGGNGGTYNVATMSDCYADSTMVKFRTYLQNAGRLEYSIIDSTDPNEQGRLYTYWKAAEEFGGDRSSNIHPNNYEEVTAHFGCTEPITVDSLTVPIPDALIGTSGSIRAVSLDYPVGGEFIIYAAKGTLNML